ncbi:hypothetical protein CC78DRAFT_576631 [Lojkania enalia]|uniref:ATP-grasp domain-containing protein n=1 Tax=Lojkania enalia TaxID=147567 RepID=A0A9P4KHD8_9PLEO|nr:hypothetical protein CC78DRAFT_576631 [Didymosphaeria enalia]
MPSQIPLVQLDRTLYDLYSIDGGDPNEVAHVLALAPPNGSASSSLPENLKYTFQSPMAPNLDNGIFARICLGNGSQNHAFMAGPIQLYLFDIDPPEHDVINGTVESPPAHHTDAQRNYNALVSSQRPRLSFIQNPNRFKPNKGVKASPYPPLDFLDNHPTVVSQDAHYRLMSKRDLALSGLPTPKTQVIEGRLSPTEALDDTLVEAEAQRIIQAVRDRSTPFVIKFPQSLAGQGVFVVRDEATKANRIRLLELEVPRMIRRLTPDNAHLQPVSLLLQDCVDGDTRNQSIFVTRSGRAEFVSTAEQFLDAEGIWRASILDYKRQGELEQMYRGVIDKVAAYVHSKGFYGPMGCDVMTDSKGNQYVVDLNVRLTGDYMMGPLRGHFYARRGLRYSYLITPLAVLGNRDRFEQRFEKELTEGRMVIVGWARGKKGKHEYSICSVVIGGKDHEHVLELADRVNAIALPKPEQTQP